MAKLIDEIQVNVKNKEFNDVVFRENTLEVIENWQDNSQWLSGWRHHYFCDDDGSYLQFEFNSPHKQVCPSCGRVYQDEKKNNAWVTIMRNKAISSLRYAMILYFETNDDKYLQHIKRLILFYADNYADFPIHLKNKKLKDMKAYDSVQEAIERGIVRYDAHTIDWSFKGYDIQFQGPGKIMAQGLSEAIALIRIGFTYKVLESKFTKDEKQHIQTDLFKPAIQFLKKQQFVDHNITLWREAAIQILGLLTNSFELADFKNHNGIYDHLDHAFTQEGLWYEGSMHYHHYVAEALAYLSYFMKAANVHDERLEQSLQKMLSASYNEAFDNGVFPNPNDGWPNINLKTYLNVYELASAAYPNNQILSQIYSDVVNNQVKRMPLPIEDEVFTDGYSSLGILVINKKVVPAIVKPKSTIHYVDSKFSILRNNKFNLFMKYGVNSLSHAHYDPLNIEFTVNNRLISKDLSNAGYGSRLVHTWYNTMLGHNSVIIDGQNSNILYQSRIIKKSDNIVAVETNDLFSKVSTNVSRTAKLLNNSLQVETRVLSEKQATIDVVQHFDDIQLNDNNQYQWQQVTLNELPEYSLESNFVRRIDKCEKISELNLTNGDLKITFKFNAVTIYRLKTVGNPSTDERMTFIFRANTTDMQVTMEVE